MIYEKDVPLGDSALFIGYVKQIDYPDSIPFILPSEVWIESTNVMVTTDSLGYYSIKTLPGLHNIKCQNKFNTRKELIEQLSYEIKKNQEVRIDFYIGYIVE